MSTTFFKEVAGHNLERFHSECIAWVLNRMPKDNEIFKNFKAGEDFKFVKAVAEVKQHDIVLLFKNSEDKYKYVFVENKTKSTLSRKFWKHSKNHKKVLLEIHANDDVNMGEKFAQKLITDGMLQTAYYQLRWLVSNCKSDYRKDLFKRLFENDYNKELIKSNKKRTWESVFINAYSFAKPEWVILSQMKKETFEGLYEGEENLNTTLSYLGLELNGENSVKDWKYLTYHDLFEEQQEVTNANQDLSEEQQVADAPDKFDTQIFQEYINYAKDLEDDSLDVVVKVKNALKKDYKINNILIEAGSSNNSEPLMEFIIGSKDIGAGFLKINDDYPKLAKRRAVYSKLFGGTIFENNKTFDIPLNKICYGIQLEGNSLKLFFKHELYHYVKPIEDSYYKEQVEVKIKLGEVMKGNSSSPKTKTFFSFSEPIKIKNSVEVVKEIMELKNKINETFNKITL
jgi:hypothetical protein